MYTVRQLRLEKGWNQNELAFHADLAPSVISQIETGKREPSATTLHKLADALGVDIPDLFERFDSPKDRSPLRLDDIEERVKEAPEEDLYELKDLLLKEVERLSDLIPLPQKLQQKLGQEPTPWSQEDKHNLRSLGRAADALQATVKRLETEAERELS